MPDITGRLLDTKKASCPICNMPIAMDLTNINYFSDNLQYFGITTNTTAPQTCKAQNTKN